MSSLQPGSGLRLVEWWVIAWRSCTGDGERAPQWSKHSSQLVHSQSGTGCSHHKSSSSSARSARDARPPRAACSARLFFMQNVCGEQPVTALTHCAFKSEANTLPSPLPAATVSPYMRAWHETRQAARDTAPSKHLHSHCASKEASSERSSERTNNEDVRQQRHAGRAQERPSWSRRHQVLAMRHTWPTKSMKLHSKSRCPPC